VDVEVDSLHVKRIGVQDLVGYVYIVRVDDQYNSYDIHFKFYFHHYIIGDEVKKQDLTYIRST
jgi:hypothetical protein